MLFLATVIIIHCNINKRSWNRGLFATIVIDCIALFPHSGQK